MSIYSWRWSLAVLAVVACSPFAQAQQKPSAVKVAEPVAAPQDAKKPAAVAPAKSAPAPTPAGEPKAPPPVVAVEPEPAPPPPPQAAGAQPTPAQPGPAQPGSAQPGPAQPAPLQHAPAPLPPAESSALVESDAPQESDAVIEVIKERYPNGAIKIEREVTQDGEGNYLLHGAWRHFDDKGHLIIDGRLLRNRKEGVWRRFYRGDEVPLLASAPYKDFTAPFVSAATFHADRLHGRWTISDGRQRKVHEIEFTDGERHGKAIWYYPSGTVMLEAIYEHGSVNGDVLKFAPDSSLLGRENFQTGRKLAPKVEFYDAAQQVKKLEAVYLHALLVIKTPDSWERGALAVFENRGHDERHGAFALWHPNGQLARQGEFRYDHPVGPVNYWFANGQKQLEGQYVDGKQQGVWTWWHENGQKAITGEYHDGAAVGQWSWWNAAGKVAQKTDLTGERAAVPQTPEAETELREAKLQLVEPGLPKR